MDGNEACATSSYMFTELAGIYPITPSSPMAEHIDENTLCGYVRNCERENEEKGILTFKELKDFQADMFTLIIIGNSTTKLIKNQLVTPRGYKGI